MQCKYFAAFCHVFLHANKRKRQQLLLNIFQPSLCIFTAQTIHDTPPPPLSHCYVLNSFYITHFTPLTCSCTLNFFIILSFSSFLSSIVLIFFWLCAQSNNGSQNIFRCISPLNVQYRFVTNNTPSEV